MARIDDVKAELAKFDKIPRSKISDSQWVIIDGLERELARLAPKRKATNIWRAGDPVPDGAWCNVTKR